MAECPYEHVNDTVHCHKCDPSGEGWSPPWVWVVGGFAVVGFFVTYIGLVIWDLIRG